MTAAGVPVAALAIAACGGSKDTPRPPRTASGRPATVGLEPAGSLGKVLVDSRGRILHLFRKDAGGRSSCVAACAAAWPPARAQGRPLAAPKASARQSSQRLRGPTAHRNFSTTAIRSTADRDVAEPA
jgi:predicted lipoprotein with Yx(FWY)xxD motif